MRIRIALQVRIEVGRFPMRPRALRRSVQGGLGAVSYTHLTLPTIYSV